MAEARTTSEAGRAATRLGPHAPGLDQDVPSDHTSSALVVLDGEGSLLSWDAGALALLGVPEGDGPPPGDPLQLGDAVRSPDEPNPTYRVVVLPDGTRRWVCVELRPIEDGRVAALLSEATGPHAAPKRRAGEDRLRKILQNINDTITIMDSEGRAIEGTGAVTSILGYPTSFWQGQDIFDLLHPDDLPKAAELLAEVMRFPGNRASSQLRIRDVNDNWQIIEGTGVNLLDDPDVGGILVTTRNVTERTRTARLVAAQAAILRLVASGEHGAPTRAAIAELVENQLGSGRCAVVVNEPGKPAEVSSTTPDVPASVLAALCDAVHGPGGAETGPGAGPALVPWSSAGPALGDVGVQLAAAGWVSGWCVAVRPSSAGGYRGGIACLFRTEHAPTAWEETVAATAADLTSIALERAWSERNMADLAFYDKLTGLANRLLLADRLEQALFRAQRTSARVALMFLDLDRFKIINDTLGHEAGDQVLREFGERLRLSVRPDDTVARFGGDEFVILVEGVRGDDDVAVIAERIERRLDEPFAVGDGIYVTASVGVVTSDGTEDSGATLLRNADTAMYRAKERGRNRLEVFDETVRSQLLDRMRLESELRRALDRRELEVRYQATVDLASGQVTGVEALVHWQHPERGVLELDAFLAVAEESGLAVPVGTWALDRALADLAAAERGRAPADDQGAGSTAEAHLVLSIALTPRQLAQPDLATTALAALARHGRPPSSLVVAMSEPAGIEGDTARANLSRLAEAGVRLAVDDFGTGRSSVSLLGGAPDISLVRISRAFLARMLGSEHTEPLVRAIIDVAHALGLQVLADGIADAGQLRSMRAMSCDLGQGPALSAPVAADQLAGLLTGR